VPIRAVDLLDARAHEPGELEQRDAWHISVAVGDTFPATTGAEVGYMNRLRYPYGYVAILAAHGRTDPLDDGIDE